MLDHTHNPNATSWVYSANGHQQFPLQNLPFGIWDRHGGRIVTAIGDKALDLKAVIGKGLLHHLDMSLLEALSSTTLNAWMQLSQKERLAIRHALFNLLVQGSNACQYADDILVERNNCTMSVPAFIGDFTDFYCGIYHAKKVGSIFRPDNPLLPNYGFLPLAYHGRCSSIRASGMDVIRPKGQMQRNSQPTLGLTKQLDFELELGIWAGPGNAQGKPIAIQDATKHIAGYSLLNDWSARDIQAWESRPLGPFQGKNFAATIGQWVITEHALLPFRCQVMPRIDAHPEPLDYLRESNDQKKGGLDIELRVFLLTTMMREKGLAPVQISQSNSQFLYWTPAQMLTQHTLGGCNLRAGDLIGTGTISTPDDSGNGSMLEINKGGKEKIKLPSGETRVFLEDGDEVIFSACCSRADLYTIGFGECQARVIANPHT